MSLESQTNVQCPKCGYNQAVTVWRSLNADVSPEAREDLLAGRINVFDCAKCDCKAGLGVPLLYHDMRRQFLVQFHPFEALDDPELFSEYDARGDSVAAAQMSQMSPGGGMEYASRVHVVLQMRELVRYVVFRERLHAHHQS